MRILFIHQNFPGQFRHTAPALAQQGHQVLALRVQQSPQEKPVVWLGVRVLPYRLEGANVRGLHPWLTDIETKTLRATACWKACRELRAQGWQPDVIVAHPGWGEPLFAKNVWPRAKLGLYAEMFYQPEGADSGFDPEFEREDPEQQACRLQMKNLNNLAHLPLADGLLSPTCWQADTFPAPWREKVTIAHDGIDTDQLAPDPLARLNLPDGLGSVTRQDEVITFVARHLEPYRGFHIFMRALPALLSARPNARVLIVGDDDKGYGAQPPKGTTWRELFCSEVRDAIPDTDWQRVHFLGRLERDDFTRLLQVSTVHIYLSYPFVLSWSLIEAMSVGCAIVASDTAPVREAIVDGEHGRLIDFFDVNGLATTIAGLANDAPQRERLGRQARARAVAGYDLKRVCLPRQLDWIKSLASRPTGA